MEWKSQSLQVEEQSVAKFLGYGNKPLPDVIRKKIEQEMKLCHAWLEPQAYYKIYPIRIANPDTLRLGDVLTIRSRSVCERMEYADFGVAVLLTIGQAIEDQINRYAGSADMMRAMILDKIGVLALDDLTLQLKQFLEQEHHPLRVCAECYPAQKDFDIRYQEELFRLFDEENTAITIRSSYQLHPVKSVAILLGLGRRFDINAKCDFCDQPCTMQSGW